MIFISIFLCILHHNSTIVNTITKLFVCTYTYTINSREPLTIPGCHFPSIFFCHMWNCSRCTRSRSPSLLFFVFSNDTAPPPPGRPQSPEPPERLPFYSTSLPRTSLNTIFRSRTPISSSVLIIRYTVAIPTFLSLFRL